MGHRKNASYYEAYHKWMLDKNLSPLGVALQPDGLLSMTITNAVRAVGLPDETRNAFTFLKCRFLEVGYLFLPSTRRYVVLDNSSHLFKNRRNIVEGVVDFKELERIYREEKEKSE